MPSIAVTAVLIAENDLAIADRKKIRALLTAAFPGYEDLWVIHDSWGGPLEQRLLLRDLSGRLVGHLGFARRVIEVGGHPVSVAGIGTVALVPDMQGQGLGRHLLHELAVILRQDMKVDFGFLQCRDAVIGFYEKSGFIRITQQIRSFDPDRRRWQFDDTAAMILPARSGLGNWPQEGLVDLMGMPW